MPATHATPDADREIVALLTAATRGGTAYPAGHQFAVRLSTARTVVAVDGEGRRVTLRQAEVRTVRPAVLPLRRPVRTVADLVAMGHLTTGGAMAGGAA